MHTTAATAAATANYFAVVCWGRTKGAPVKAYYRSEASALRDARRIAAAGSVNVRVLGYDTRAEAEAADVANYGRRVRYIKHV